MHWKTISLATFTAAALFAASVPANAAGADATGDLGAGGTAKGDISMAAGQNDRITISLVEGVPLDVTFTATFNSSFTLTDPDAMAVDIGTAGGNKVKLRGFAITKTGTYTFAISSSDGSQGVYSLVATQRWTKSFPASGSGQVSIDVSMPAAGQVAAAFTRERNAPGQPRILSLLDPSGTDLLAAPVEPVKNSVKLAPTTAQVPGNYRLVVTATDGSSPWKGLVKRILPRVKPARISLTNGLDAVSYSGDGVDQVFKRNCSGCHSWAGSYAGVKAKAAAAYGKIRAGAMPPTGRLPAQQTSLVQSWIQTGKVQ